LDSTCALNLGRIGRVPGHGLRDVGQLGPGRVLYNEGALLGKVALAVLAVLPHGSGGEDGRGGDVEEDVDRGVEMGEDTCDSQRHRKCSDFAVNGVVGNGELPGGLNAMTPIFS
jgi:hypothetical protein